VPVVLCYLEGKSHEQAARELAWPKSSLSARLGRARQLLQERLTRRGVAPAAGLLAVALTEEASAAVPALLTLATVRLAVTGNAAPASAPAVALADGVAHGMVGTKLLLAAGFLLSVSLAVAGALVRPAEAPPAPAQAPVQAPATPPQAEKAGPARADLFGDALPAGALARMGTVRLRHGDRVLAALFTHDGKSLITAGQDSTLRQWDTATGKERGRLSANSNTFVMTLALTPDGTTLVGRGSSELVVWDLAGRARPRQFRVHANAYINCAPLVLAPDGKTVATAGEDKTIRLWALDTGKELRRFEGHKDHVPGLAFAPDGKTLASASFDRTVRLWSVADGKELKQLTGHAGQVWSVAFSRDGQTLASGGGEGVSLWDLATGKKVRSLRAHGLGGLAFTPDGNLLVGGQLWDLATGKEISRFGAIGFCCLSQDGKTLATWGHSIIRLWDFATGKERRAFVGHEYEPRALAFAPDGKRLVSGSWRDPAVFVWDAATGKELHRWVGAPIKAAFGGLLGGGSDHPSQNGATAVAFSPDGKRLAAGNGLSWATVHVWDTAAGKELRGFSTGQSMIAALAFTPDGQAIVSASLDQQVSLWDQASGASIRRLVGPNGQHKAIAFSPDAKTLLVAGADYQGKEYGVQAWDLATGEGRLQLPRKDGPVASLSFSPDGRLLAVGGFNQETMRVLEVVTGKERPAVSHGRWLETLAFSPDGRSLALAAGGKVQLLEMVTGKERAHFDGHQGIINALAFTADGNRLASASRDMTILVWDLLGRTPAALGAKDKEDLWGDLGADDAVKAYRAIQALIAAGEPAVALLQERLRSLQVAAPDKPGHIDQLLEQLDSAKFDERSRAMKELTALGNLAEGSLRKALAGKPSLETRRRIEQLVDQLNPARTPEGLRRVRALEVLERIGGAGARRVLEELAGGPAEASLTLEAKGALDRLQRRAVAAP
jgi:WD40 repeat protein